MILNKFMIEIFSIEKKLLNADLHLQLKENVLKMLVIMT